MAVKDSIGGWKDNALIYKSTNVCRSMKMFAGKSLIPILNSLGMNIVDCPLPVV